MKKTNSLRNLDFHAHGYVTMMTVKNEEQARKICGADLLALEQELQPEIASCKRNVDLKRVQGQALASQLYRRPVPLSDLDMVALLRQIRVNGLLFIVALTAGIVSNTATFFFFGWGWLASILIGMAVTAVVLVAGHQFYDRVLLTLPLLQKVFVSLSFLLAMWGLVEFLQARTAMAGAATPTSQDLESFVDEPSTVQEPAEDEATSASDEIEANRSMGSGIAKIALGVDLILGFLFGLLTTTYTARDFSSWRDLKTKVIEIAKIERKHDELLAIIDTSRLRCAAGILLAKPIAIPPHHPPYFKLFPIVLVFVLAGMLKPVAAQPQLERQESYLIDASGSVGKRGQSGGMFGEYLAAVRRLLAGTPPNTRTTVLLVSSDSFGGASTVLSGWTPSARGIFTSNLERARRQLVASFEEKSKALSPVAASTDLFGGLWRVKTTLESEPGNARMLKHVYMASDMVVETASFNLPALAPHGVDRMIEIAKANGSIVPLQGVRVHVFGATTIGSTPALWNVVREFWQRYFQLAGAELVMYSSESSISR